MLLFGAMFNQSKKDNGFGKTLDFIIQRLSDHLFEYKINTVSSFVTAGKWV